VGRPEPVGSSAIVIDFDNRQQAFTIDQEHLVGLLGSTIADQHGPNSAEVGLAFISVEEMTNLNVVHMGGTGPTDVLAFPIDGVDDVAVVPPGQPAILGDIVVCPVVADQAPQDLPDELALLVVHGALHLLGHDHAEPDERALMQSLEVDLLQRFHRT